MFDSLIDAVRDRANTIGGDVFAAEVVSHAQTVVKLLEKLRTAALVKNKHVIRESKNALFKSLLGEALGHVIEG